MSRLDDIGARLDAVVACLSDDEPWDGEALVALLEALPDDLRLLLNVAKAAAELDVAQDKISVLVTKLRPALAPLLDDDHEAELIEQTGGEC